MSRTILMAVTLRKGFQSGEATISVYYIKAYIKPVMKIPVKTHLCSLLALRRQSIGKGSSSH